MVVATDFEDSIQQRVERSLFEALRVKLVDKGRIPDITDNIRYPTVSNKLTVEAQANWNQDIKAIENTYGWAIGLFSTSNVFSKGIKAIPRVVVVPKRIMPGDIGFGPGLLYVPIPGDDNLVSHFDAVLTPDTSANMHFDIHLVTSSQAQSRFLNMLLSTIIGIRKYITFFDNADERFFIKQFNYYDVSDQNDGIEENVYSFEVQDLYLFPDSVPVVISPILEIDTNIIIGYTVTPDQIDTGPLPGEGAVLIGDQIRTGIAGENLGGGKLVYIRDNKFYIYDANNTDLADLAFGITVNSAVTDGSVKVQISGVFKEVGLGLTSNETYFAGLNGLLTDNPDDYLVYTPVGIAIDADSFKIEIQPSVIN